jgi:hypothetical protein
MRCFFMRAGHNAAAEELPELSAEEAVAKSRQMFEERKTEFRYDGFEVWQLSRMVMQYPPFEATPEAGAIPIFSKRSGKARLALSLGFDDSPHGVDAGRRRRVQGEVDRPLSGSESD